MPAKLNNSQKKFREKHREERRAASILCYYKKTIRKENVDWSDAIVEETAKVLIENRKK